MARLFVLPENPGDQPLELNDKLVLVGREPDNLLQIEDQNVSKHHALLIHVDDTYQVYDLHSANGTYVNDERVTAAKLKDGDVLRFGPGLFRFETRPAGKRIGLKVKAATPAPAPAPAAPPVVAAPLPPSPPATPAPMVAAPPPQVLKAIPRKPATVAPPLPPAAPPAPPAPAPAGLGARPLQRKPAPEAAPATPTFPAGTDAKETAAAALQAPPPGAEPTAEPEPEPVAEPAAGDEIPRERTLRFKPPGSGGELRLRLKK